MNLPEKQKSDIDLLKDIDQNRWDFQDPATHVFKSERGLSEEVVRQISAHKDEPEWMLDFRLKAFQHFLDRPMPNWGADLSGIDFDEIYYYIKPSERDEDNWEDVLNFLIYKAANELGGITSLGENSGCRGKKWFRHPLCFRG